MASERIAVRSYRSVFHVDRRIYRVDRWAIPVPGGIPLRGVFYFGAALIAVLLLTALPLIGALLGSISPPLRYVVLPAAVAVVGTQVAPDGRVAHRFALDWLALRLRRRRTSAGRPIALAEEPLQGGGSFPARADAGGAALRRGRVRGPAVMRFRDLVHVRRRRRRRIYSVRPRTGRSKKHTAPLNLLELQEGETAEVRP